MASQSEDFNQAAIATEYDFAPHWLNNAKSIEDGQNMLADLCTNYEVQRASVLVSNQMLDNMSWEVMLSSSGSVELAEILPIESLLGILNEDLRQDKLATARLPAIDGKTGRHLFFVVVDSKSLQKMVFAFESDHEPMFANLAALRLISDVLCKNFTDNRIFELNNEQQEQKLTETEFELLRLKSAGQSDEYLAEVLNLSPTTIYYLLQRIMKKLGCPNTHSAVAKFSKLDR